jgi:hypothetical protein
MNNKPYLWGTGALLLVLLAGAGCAPKPQATIQTGADANINAMEAEKQDQGFGASIDAFFEAIIGTDEEEQTEEEQAEEEANTVSGTVDINSYSEASYDTK